MKRALRLTALEKPLQTSLDTLTQSGALEEWANRASVPEVFALVRKNGVEECAELIRFLPADKLRAVIDLDVWKNTSGSHAGGTGRTERFDAAQFLLWLQALLMSEVDEAIEALLDMGTEFCAGAFSYFLSATPMDVYSMNKAESGLGTEDKNIEHGNPLELGVFGESYVLLKPGLCLEDVQETFQEILSGFEQHAPEALKGIFFHISHQVDDEVVIDDFKAGRNLRLENLGYTPAPKAAEYLLRFRTEWGIQRFSGTGSSGHWPVERWIAFVQSHAHVHGHQREHEQRPSAFMQNPDIETSVLHSFFNWTSQLDKPAREAFQAQWIYLANLLANGWEVLGTKMGPKKAMQFLEATVSLALDVSTTENSHSSYWRGLHSISSVCDLFEIGWHYLLHKVALPAAQKLDARLRLRDPRNAELRETWFRFCSQKKFEEFLVSRWILEGRYRLVAELLSECEFALGSENTLNLALLLDSSPRLPKHQSKKPTQSTSDPLSSSALAHLNMRRGDSGSFQKVTYKGRFIRLQSEVLPVLQELENGLSCLDDPMDLMPFSRKR